MIIVLMGVCACGKSTIGRLLSQELNWPFYDGDDYHSEMSRQKMAAGIPLTDDDRRAWLQSLSDLARHETEQGRSAIIACSALKFAYRNALRGRGETNKAAPVAVVDMRFVYLKLTKEEAERRLKQRKGHFFNSGLVQSQFLTLEEPNPENEGDVLIVDAAKSIEEVVQDVKTWVLK